VSAYVTQAQMIERFGETELRQLTDRAVPPSGAVDAAIVTAAITDACALIDSYLGKVAALPLASPPVILTRHAADIARYFLHGRRAEKDDPITRAYHEALGWLRDAARGLVSLTDAAGQEPTETGGGLVRFNGDERVFSRDSMKGF
jgi:phage gp36-like protein